MEARNSHVQHFLRKCFTALAVSIIKSKPSELSIKEFCKCIQNKLKDETRTELFHATEDFESNVGEINDFLELLNIGKTPKVNEECNHENNKSDTYTDSVKQNTKVNLKLIRAVRDIINITNVNNEEMSQDSGFDTQSTWEVNLSQKSENEGFNVEKRLNKLDNALSIVVNFLYEVPHESSQDFLFNSISNIFGKTICILCKQNVFIPSINKAVDMVEEILNEFLNNSENHMELKWRNKLKSFYAFNNTTIFINNSLMKLIAYLEEFLNKLKCSKDIIEFDNPEYFNKLFFVFEIIERLFYKYNEVEITESEISNKSKLVKITDMTKSVITSELLQNNTIVDQNWNLSSENHYHIPSNFEDKLMKVLNQLTLECIESYPLLSFWAMECIKIRNIKM